MGNVEQVKILVVDDESPILNSLRRVFSETDFIFTTAGSGNEGLKFCGSTARSM